MNSQSRHEKQKACTSSNIEQKQQQGQETPLRPARKARQNSRQLLCKESLPGWEAEMFHSRKDKELKPEHRQAEKSS